MKPKKVPHLWVRSGGDYYPVHYGCEVCGDGKVQTARKVTFYDHNGVSLSRERTCDPKRIKS